MHKYDCVAQFSFLFHAKTCRCRCMHCKGRGGGGQWGPEEFETVSYKRARAAMEPIYAWYEALEEKPFRLLLGASEVADFEDTEKLMRLHTRVYGQAFAVCNGMDFMSPDELDAFFTRLYAAGARVCMTTFFGTEAFHDRFAGREGDFRYLLDVNRAAQKAGLNKLHILFLSRPNLPYLDELTELLTALPGKKQIQYRPIFNKPDAFTPEEDRLTRAEYAAAEARYHASIHWPLKTKAEWYDYILSGDYSDKTHDLSRLTPQVLLGGTTLRELEEMTDVESYLDAVVEKHTALRLGTPDMKTLCRLYGDPEPENDRMYTFCDLEYAWKAQYQAEHGGAPMFYL